VLQFLFVKDSKRKTAGVIADVVDTHLLNKVLRGEIETPQPMAAKGDPNYQTKGNNWIIRLEKYE
jgi:hypothetical protein